MRIEIGRAVSVVDPDNLHELSVLVVGVPDDEAARSLAATSLGVLDADHAWLDIVALRGAGPDTEVWRTDFDAMIEWAGSSGWVSAGRVRAHVVRR